MPLLSHLNVSQVARPSHTGVLRAGGCTLPCTLGPGGVRARKREGDAATPAGTWPLRCVYYRPDRVNRPRTALPVYRIAADDGWCDDPLDDRYNRPVKMPYPASAEHLYRDDTLYDIVVVLGHNDAPVVPGAGSCVFFHLTGPERGPTAGCVAVTLHHMNVLLARCGTNTSMRIR